VKRTILSLALLASLAAGAAFAADPTAAPAPPKKGGFDPNQIICREVGETGSHLPGERVCATWADWQAQSDHDAHMMTEASDRPGAATTGGMEAVTNSPAPNTSAMRR
jgi:hypothetical protein